MKIKILGSRGNVEPKAPYHSRYSGILIDEYLIVDIGEKEYMKEKFNKILFTHQGSWFIKDVPGGREKWKKLNEKNLKIEAAYDSMEFSV